MPTMSTLMCNDEVDDLEFRWGVKGGTGGIKKNVQFYKSFTYDGLEYSLFDSVYLFKHGESDPYIGKLIKIWELASKAKKIKVLWFFRPSEISSHLGGLQTLKNELFLGTGNGADGSGLENVNPLEAIAGKCNVVCISKDARNRQPLQQELTMADYIFYRTFDVDKFTITDKLGEQISKVEVRLLLNKADPQISNPLRIESDVDAGANNISLKIEETSGKKAAALLSPSGADDLGSLDGQPYKKLKYDDYSRNALNLAGSSGKCNLKELSKPAEDSNEKKKNEYNKDSRGSFKVKSRVNSTDANNVSVKIEETSGKKVAALLSPPGAHDLGSLDGQPYKKLKSDDYSRNALNLAGSSGKCNLKEFSKPAEDSNEKKNNEYNKDSRGSFKVKSQVNSADVSLDDRPSKKLKFAEPMGIGGKTKAPVSSGLDGANAHSKQSNKEDRVYGRVVEVTRRPETDSSKWFTGLPWEERMKDAQEEGTLVLLQNLDPSYTSSEIEDIVWHSFRENCTAKVLHCAAISSPHSGQAFVIFRTKQAAVRAARELEEGCLMLPNGRPLLGHVAVGPLPGKSSSFPGHICIDKLKFQMQKDKREAVSTSHSSQPNTFEYDMAMEWRVLQERSELVGKNLLKKQGEELKKLKGDLRRKL